MSMTGKKRSCFSHLFHPIFIHSDPGMQQIATLDNVYGLHRIYRLSLKIHKPVWEKTKKRPFILEAGNFLSDKEDLFFPSPKGNFSPNFQPSHCNHLVHCSSSASPPFLGDFDSTGFFDYHIHDPLKRRFIFIIFKMVMLRVIWDENDWGSLHFPPELNFSKKSTTTKKLITNIVENLRTSESKPF